MLTGMGAVVGTIIGSLLGFLASVLPMLYDMASAWLKHKRDLATNQQKLDTVVRLGEKANVAIDTTAVLSSTAPSPDPMPLAVSNTVPADEERNTGGWVMGLLNLLRASVRPVVTYAFFMMFAYVKLSLMFHALFVDHAPATTLLPLVWDEGTESLFAAVLAFWFGSRAFAKAGTKTATTSTVNQGSGANGAQIVGENTK